MNCENTPREAHTQGHTLLHFYESSRTGKSRDRKQTDGGQRLGDEGEGGDCLTGTGFLLGVMKYSKVRLHGWLHNAKYAKSFCTVYVK